MSGIKTIFDTALTDTWTATQGEVKGDKPGDIRWVQDSTVGAKCYKLFISSGATDFIAGDVVGYIDDTGYAAHTVTVTASTSKIGAGVAMAAVTLTAIRFWAQIRGPATLNTPLKSTTNNGDGLTWVSTDDKTLELAAAVDDCIVAYTVDDANNEIICNFPF